MTKTKTKIMRSDIDRNYFFAIHMAPCVKDVNVILISRGFDSREFGTKEESARFEEQSLVNFHVRKYLNIIESLWQRNNQLQLNYIIIYLPYLLTHTLFYMHVKVKWQYTYTHISILTIKSILSGGGWIFLKCLWSITIVLKFQEKKKKLHSVSFFLS